MRAYRAMQVLKNGLYRTTGEAVRRRIAARRHGSGRSACSCTTRSTTSTPNPITVPTAAFAEQMTLLGELGYTPVSLEAVRDHYLADASLPAGAVLITFDDGYLDNLENAAPDPASSTATRP